MTATRAQTGYAPVDGLEMYYEISGTGRPLVLLHGELSAIGTSFGKVLPSLSKSRQVIAVEQQAHGRTADIVCPEHPVETYRLLGGGVAGDIVGLPRSRLAVLLGTTHITIVDRADWLSSMVTEFLDAPMPEGK
jgi:pimeloyl-ACP methyl ester carboxylesterase